MDELTFTPIFFGEVNRLWRVCGCGTPITWVRTANGHQVALDADEHGHPIPQADGNLVVVGRYHPPVVRLAQTGDPLEPRYRAHTAGCGASTHR